VHNTALRLATLRTAMLPWLKTPPSAFKRAILGHFWYKRDEIIAQARQWVTEVEAMALWDTAMRVELIRTRNQLAEVAAAKAASSSPTPKPPPPKWSLISTAFAKGGLLGEQRRLEELKAKAGDMTAREGLLKATYAEWANAVKQAFAPYNTSYLRPAPVDWPLKMAMDHGVPELAVCLEVPSRRGAGGASSSPSAASGGAAAASGGAGGGPVGYTFVDAAPSDVPSSTGSWASGGGSAGGSAGSSDPASGARFCGHFRPVDVAYNMRQTAEELVALLKGMKEPEDLVYDE
jgi:hypothetical protein